MDRLCHPWAKLWATPDTLILADPRPSVSPDPLIIRGPALPSVGQTLGRPKSDTLFHTPQGSAGRESTLPSAASRPTVYGAAATPWFRLPGINDLPSAGCRTARPSACVSFQRQEDTTKDTKSTKVSENKSLEEIPFRFSSWAKHCSYVDSSNPGPSARWTSMAQPITRLERTSNSILRALRVLRGNLLRHPVPSSGTTGPGRPLYPVMILSTKSRGYAD